MAPVREWTVTDLQRMHSLYAAGYGTAEIAVRLGRDEQEITDHLSIARQRSGPVPLAEAGTQR